MRIATAGVRTGFAMTGFCREYGERIPQSRLRHASPPLGKGAEGTGMRIATAGVRTGFAMTWFIMGESHLVGGWLMPVGGGNACIRSCW